MMYLAATCCALFHVVLNKDITYILWTSNEAMHGVTA